jgi:hypothetical protein
VTTQQINLGGLTLTIPADWYDASDEQEDEIAPFTLIKCEDGLGALQFSIAIATGGQPPNPKVSELLEMAKDTATHLGLSESFDEVMEESRLLLGAASYRWDGHFLRIWFVSDHYNFAKISYVCEWGAESAELNDCEAIIRSTTFP